MTPKFSDLKNYSDVELAAWCICGYLGSGAVRKKRLGERYNAVQQLVNNILKTGDIPYAGTKTADYEVIAEAVKNAYSEAADELIESIKERIK